MPRYTLSEERLEEKIRLLAQKKEEDAEKAELRKRRDHLRRRVNATLYHPRTCLGDPISGAVCTRLAVPGATLCPEHGGTTKAMQQAAKMRLLYLVEPALRVINKCLASGDLNIALRAAQILLDRAGFHPHATLEIKEQPVDLSGMSDQQLRARAARLLAAMDQAAIEPDENVLDMEVTEEEQDPSVH